MLELFALNEDVDARKAIYQSDPHQPELSNLVALAWYVRQSDKTLAMQLVEKADSLIAASGTATPQSDSSQARVLLVRSEIAISADNIPGSQEFADRALALFSRQQDLRGIGDCKFTLSNIAYSAGNLELVDELLEQCISAYRDSGDKTREHFARLRLISARALLDTDQAQRWLQEVEAELQYPLNTVTVFSLETAKAFVCCQVSQYAESAGAFARAHHAAMATGQIAMAVQSAINVGANLEGINDANSALMWLETGLDIARKHGLQTQCAVCLSYTGRILLKVNRNELALKLLLEALDIIPPGHDDRVNASVFVADAYLALHRWRDAITWYQAAETLFKPVERPIRPFVCKLGCARAMYQLGDYRQASALCEEALSAHSSHTFKDLESEAYLLMADICRGTASTGQLPLGSHTPLYYLERAHELALSIEGYIVPINILESLATEYARLGDYAKAYSMGVASKASREAIASQDAHNRANALQVSRVTEQLKLEAEQHRIQKEREAQRANDLSQTNETLKILGDIGREITASLQISEVFKAIQRNVMKLLDAYSLVIFQISPDETHLELSFGVENGQSVPSITLAMDDATSLNACCARERREIIMELDASEGFVVQGTSATQSMMFAPLLSGQQLLGVMTIQSLNRNAYGEREQAIFRSLCSYGAVALANARAQEQVLQQNRHLDRMATTDQLTGLFNRRYLDGVLEREYASAVRYGQEFSIMIIDIDHFKSVNDTYGHHAGDEVLATFAKLLQSRVRDSDVVGRWGGEEFLVICTGTALTDARALAESMRALIEHSIFPHVGRKTASFGVACYREGDTIASMGSRADRGLYDAKEAGRNQVGISEG